MNKKCHSRERRGKFVENFAKKFLILGQAMNENAFGELIFLSLLLFDVCFEQNCSKFKFKKKTSLVKHFIH